MKDFATKFRPFKRLTTRFVAGEDIDEATEAIRAINATGATASFDHLNEGVSRAEGGYHETITRFYMWAVRRELLAEPLDKSLAELANDLAVALADRSLPLVYWSRERLMSAAARAGWVEPDLRSLD